MIVGLTYGILIVLSIHFLRRGYTANAILTDLGLNSTEAYIYFNLTASVLTLISVNFYFEKFGFGGWVILICQIGLIIYGYYIIRSKKQIFLMNINDYNKTKKHLTIFYSFIIGCFIIIPIIKMVKSFL